MTNLNISVPESIEDWVFAQVQTGAYVSTGDYVLDLIRKDQAHKTGQAAMQQAITEGLASGISDKSFDQIINLARKELAGR